MSRLRRAPVWLVLTVAVLAELVGTVSLKASDGLREPLWTLSAAASLGLALLLLGVLLRRRPLGIVYAVWSGAGAVLSAVAGLARYGERLTLAQLAGLICVVVGILLLEARGGES
jgi:small multidrug resistance pump